MTRDYNFLPTYIHTCGRSHLNIWLNEDGSLIGNDPVNKMMVLPTTEDLLLPKAQMHAHSGGTVKLARAHCDSI